VTSTLSRTTTVVQSRTETVPFTMTATSYVTQTSISTTTVTPADVIRTQSFTETIDVTSTLSRTTTVVQSRTETGKFLQSSQAPKPYSPLERMLTRSSSAIHHHLNAIRHPNIDQRNYLDTACRDAVPDHQRYDEICVHTASSHFGRNKHTRPRSSHVDQHHYSGMNPPPSPMTNYHSHH
jgi:hypothetical protein